MKNKKEVREQYIDKFRAFEGVWIPIEILLDDKLSFFEKGLLTQIISLCQNNCCYASNKYFACFMHVSEQTITRAIKRLSELNYISTYQPKGKARQCFINSNHKIKNDVEETKQDGLLYKDILNNLIDYECIEIENKEIVFAALMELYSCDNFNTKNINLLHKDIIKIINRNINKEKFESIVNAVNHLDLSKINMIDMYIKTAIINKLTENENNKEALTKNNNTTTAKAESKKKKPYGKYENVYLSIDELETLQQQKPSDWEKRIESVSIYLEENKKQYFKNTLSKLLNWYENENENNAKKAFIKPSLEEVKAYCDERNNNVDAEQFIDYYESNGWKVGKNTMKDWKAAIRTWEKHNFKTTKKKQIIYEYNEIESSEQDIDALRKELFGEETKTNFEIIN